MTDANAFGEILFSKYLYPFELASVLLLVAIIGSVVLAKEAKRPLPAGRGLRDKQQQLSAEEPR